MIPNSAIISEVPFVSWSDAPNLAFSEGVNANPSQPACVLMLTKYWANGLDRSERIPRTLTLPDDWDTWQSDKGNAKGIDDLKQPLANGYPVHVSSGATPVGHYWGNPFLYLSGPFAAEKLGQRSDILGFIAPYEMFWATGNSRILWEVVFLTDRVVIGYDDDKHVLIIHDPSFGPAWEVSYDEFDQMWEPYNRSYSVLHPQDASAKLEKRSKLLPYRERSTDERAAYHYVFGYALACSGKCERAKAHFRLGLELSNLNSGYCHLFFVELAVQAMSVGDATTAMELLQKAVALVPYHYLPCRMIKSLYVANPGAKGRLSSYLRSWVARWLGTDSKLRDALPKNILLFPNGMTFMGVEPPSDNISADD